MPCTAVSFLRYEPNGFRIGAGSDPEQWPESEPVPNGGKVQWREFYYPALKNMHDAIMLDPVATGQDGITALLEKMAQVCPCSCGWIDRWRQALWGRRMQLQCR